MRFRLIYFFLFLHIYIFFSVRVLRDPIFRPFTIPPLGNDSDNIEQLVTRCRATNFARDHNEFPLSSRTLIVQLSREREVPSSVVLIF